jgi:hypothetical protein
MIVVKKLIVLLAAAAAAYALWTFLTGRDGRGRAAAGS